MGFWDTVVAHIEHNWEIYMAMLSAFAIASICTMPELLPKSAQDLWTWLRSSLQLAVPAARQRQANPTQPENPPAITK